ncbi:hypothetical protein FB451DRAFT_1141366 [Mycena latifolia]|nr:hypothetical protein FB451DRAFT_1141366 [Mycena latifolia]
MAECWKCGATPFPPSLPPAPPSVELTRLLMSNEAPHSSEVPSVLHALSDSQARLDFLDARIESVRGTLAELCAERNETTKALRQHKAILSPLRRVPPELLCEIFSLTMPWSRCIDTVDVHQPPWGLAHVCASWRHAAVTYPALWRYFDLGHSFSASVMEQYPISLLETTLLRSANVSLDVTFRGWCDQGVDIDPAWLDLFLPHCNRWAAVHILFTDTFDAFRDILRRVKGQLPALQILSVYNDPRAALEDYFAVAPMLLEVLLSTHDLTQPSPPLAIPWGQITRYRGVYTPARQFEILQAAPNLVQCGLGFASDDDEVELEEDQVVTLPSLRRLDLQDSSFLNHLRLPSLEALFLLSGADALPSLIQRSSCRLTKLVLTRGDITIAFPTILRCIPSLTDLVLGVRSMQKPKLFFEAMVLSGSPADLCPNLTSFAFGPTSTRFPASNTFLAMVRSRVRPTLPSRLSFLRICNVGDETGDQHHRPPAALLAGIQQLADEGLDAASLSTQTHSAEIEALKRMAWSDVS